MQDFVHQQYRYCPPDLEASSGGGVKKHVGVSVPQDGFGSFRKLGLPYLGVLIIRILLSRVLYWDPLFSETPVSITAVGHEADPTFGNPISRCRAPNYL